MFSKNRKRSSLFEVVTYTLPQLHTKKTWYVDFFCWDPADGKMRRKKYMLDSIPSKSERRKRATEIIVNATNRLRQGWNPWAEVVSNRQYYKLAEVIDIYLRYIDKLLATAVMKYKTAIDYKSRIKMLCEYNGSCFQPVIYMYQFDQPFISDFLDYILLDRDASPRTRNNYRTWLSAFCSWLLEKRFLLVNPCENIKALPEEQKFRSALTRQQLQSLRSYLEKKNKNYLLACQMEYYTFIRPDELSNIRVGDIKLKEQKVFISSAISKNRRDGMVGLNDGICRMLLDLDVLTKPSTYYLFGRDFKPSEEKADSRIFREGFMKVRKALNFPANLQFYSLKDSGIRDLANAEGIVIARDQARHADITTTNKYLKGDALTVHEETKHFDGAL